MLLVGLVAVVAHLGELESFLALARRAEPRWLAVALLLQASTYVSAAAVWHATLRRGGAPVAMRVLVPLSLAKLFADQAVPTGGLSGSLLAADRLVRGGVPEGIAMAALLVGLIGYYTAYAAMVVTALVILRLAGLIDPLSLALAGALLGLALVIPLVILRLRRLEVGALPRWLATVPGFPELLRAMAAAPAHLLRDPRLIGRAILFQGLVFLADALTLWAMLHAVGQAAGFAPAYVAFVTASVVATLSPIPLGLGTFETACVAMLRLTGVRVEPALAATLLLRGCTLWLPMLPGLWLVRR